MYHLFYFCKQYNMWTYYDSYETKKDAATVAFHKFKDYKIEINDDSEGEHSEAC